jgi:cation:H+ antiporter
MVRAVGFRLGETNGAAPAFGLGGGAVPLAQSRPAPSVPSVSLILTVVLLLGAAGLIYIACAYFVNGVEWVGRRLDMGHHATGTILAAFGTALPESVVTFVAVAFGATAAQKQIGVGAALGGPLVLSTIAYATVGVSLWLTGRHLPHDAAAHRQSRQLSRDQGWFLALFVAKVALGVTVFAIKPVLGVAFLAAYALYFWREVHSEAGSEEEALEPLKFAPRAAAPPFGLAVLQTLIALGVIFVASRIFVTRLEFLGEMLSLPPQTLSLLLTPIATELPETLNAVIWVRQGKLRLALANISGAMMIQATVPTALGLFFTPWLFEPPLILAAGVTTLAVIALFIGFRFRRVSRLYLMLAAGFYVVFALALVGLPHLTAWAAWATGTP